MNISESARRILQLNRITNISADYLNRLPIQFVVEISNRSSLQSQLSRIPTYPDYLEEQLRLRKEPELKKLTAASLIKSADQEALNKLAVVVSALKHLAKDKKLDDTKLKDECISLALEANRIIQPPRH